MNQTNQKLIFAVIGAAILMSISFVVTLEVLVIFFPDREVNDKVFTALLTAGGNVLSFMFGVLVNTRTAPPSSTTEATIKTTTATEPELTTSTIPTQVEVVNQPDAPVPTVETK